MTAIACTNRLQQELFTGTDGSRQMDIFDCIDEERTMATVIDDSGPRNAEHHVTITEREVTPDEVAGWATPGQIVYVAACICGDEDVCRSLAGAEDRAADHFWGF